MSWGNPFFLRICDKIIIVTDGTRDIDIDIDDFQRLFYIAFAITTYKSQGQTFNKPYLIHEWSRYSSKMKYVALSRSTSKELVNFTF